MLNRTSFVLAACALLVAACGATGTTAAPSTTTSTTASGTTTAGTTTVVVAACRVGALHVSLGPGEGAAGHYYVPIVFTNTGRTCTITGYPGVSYYAGADQHQVGDPAAREAGTVRTVTLHTGESAYAWLNQVNVDNYDPALCQPVKVDGIRVYPPDNTSAVLLPEPNARGCSLHLVGQQQLTVRTVSPGAGPK